MKILSLLNDDGLSAFEVFLHTVSNKLAAAICKKIHAYSELNDIYLCNSLKILNPRIWGYQGTIYKLRVDCGKESARVLFVKTPDNDIVLLHGFMKKTRKTPSKDARIAMENLERLKKNKEVTQFPLSNIRSNVNSKMC
jgi:phage-related protein